MKITRTWSAMILVAIVAMGLSWVRAAEDTDQPKQPEAVVTQEGMLSDEEMKQLVTIHTNAEPKTVCTMRTSAGRQSFNTRTTAGKRQLEEYKKSGMIPYRFTAYLSETPEGQRRGKRISGNAQVYMLDDAGNTVLNKVVSLDKLCPS